MSSSPLPVSEGSPEPAPEPARDLNLSRADAASGEVKGTAPAHALEPAQAPAPDRRADIDAKQAWVAQLLTDVGCDLLLIMDQSNLAWLTSGASARGLLAPDELPGLCYAPTQRWLLCSNFDSQRMFDEELDGFGFLLKEWPWHARRDGVLADLCRGRKVAADVPLPNAKCVSEQLQTARLALTVYEQACLRQLAKVVVHALEATGRSCNPGETERELSGQIAHRLLRYGAVPVALSVSGDGRSRDHRRRGFTSHPVTTGAVLAATARKFGLHVTAARTFRFGRVDEKEQEEHLAACRVCATYMASSWPDAVPHDILTAAQRVFRLTHFEHEWERCPQGFVTGRIPIERTLDLTATDVLRTNCAVTWGPSVGASLCQSTLLVTETGPANVTPTENWATASIKVSGEEFICPYILER